MPGLSVCESESARVKILKEAVVGAVMIPIG